MLQIKIVLALNLSLIFLFIVFFLYKINGKYRRESMAMENIPRGHTYVFALYTYDGVEPGDLSFKSGDLLEVR